MHLASSIFGGAAMFIIVLGSFYTFTVMGDGKDAFTGFDSFAYLTASFFGVIVFFALFLLWSPEAERQEITPARESSSS